jgi:hypothetical protein
VATSPSAAPAVKPTPVARPTPYAWSEARRPGPAVPMKSLAFGVRVRHRTIPGVFKVVRECCRLGNAPQATAGS